MEIIQRFFSLENADIRIGAGRSIFRSSRSVAGASGGVGRVAFRRVAHRGVGGGHAVCSRGRGRSVGSVIAGSAIAGAVDSRAGSSSTGGRRSSSIASTGSVGSMTSVSNVCDIRIAGGTGSIGSTGSSSSSSRGGSSSSSNRVDHFYSFFLLGRSQISVGRIDAVLFDNVDLNAKTTDSQDYWQQQQHSIC